MRFSVLLLLAAALLSPALASYAQSCPTVVVIIPETVTIGPLPRQVPDPAAETAIIHWFLEYGFHVVDQTQVALVRYSDLVKNGLAGDPASLLQLSERFSADILVLGEAFAEENEVRGTIQSARARVELRAIESKTGRILAAEAYHTGGIDLTLNTAAKKALQRAGDGIACPLARKLATAMPRQCPVKVPDKCRVKVNVATSPFENQSQLRMSGIGELFATKVSTELSEHGCATVQLMATDVVVTGVITDWNQVLTPAIPIPIFDLLFRMGTMWMTVDVQAFDLRTSELKAFQIRDMVSGIEIFGIRFGFSPQDMVGKLSHEIAVRLNSVCSGK
jgi:hypothetical protein